MDVERLVLIGHPVSHSLSPVFQSAALRAAGIAATYEAVNVAPADLPGMVARMRIERLRGNVTVPHKEAFHAHCDIVGDVARRVGAVNCFWCDSAGQLHGENTDVGGFDAAARRLLADLPAHALDVLPSPAGQTVALLAPKLRGDQLSFSFFTKPNDNATRHQFTGTVKGETVEGIVKVGEGASQQSLPWTAKMVERKAGPQ